MERIAVLEDDRWIQVRVKGSHRQFHHRAASGSVTAAENLSMEMPSRTLNSALKQAGHRKPE
jgi:predicted RNA binding protein YcfA (HicA-like mRNA interferase family)